jgi:serine/threonine protein kinase/beta-lactam-binding protein with PASTA domain
MAVVYSAFDTRLDRQVAVKVMHPALAADEDFVARFRREAKAAARLSSPHVVSVTDQGQDGDVIFLVMELIEGRTLREVLREHGKLAAPEALSIMIPVLEALAAAHRAGLVHRDVKPENVLVADDGAVKVGDFGLARAVDASPLTATTGLLMGTVAYLAPEQVARGVADARADVYACGVMLFELLTGKPPFHGPTPLQVAYQHLNDTVPAPSSRAVNIPKSVDRLVADATARDPEGRPHDATAMLFRTRAVLDRIAPDGIGSISHHPTAPLEIDLDLAEAAALEEARKRRWSPRQPDDDSPADAEFIDGDFVDGIDGIPSLVLDAPPRAGSPPAKHDTLDDVDEIDDADLVEDFENEFDADADDSDADDSDADEGPGDAPRHGRRSRRQAKRAEQRRRDQEIKASRKGRKRTTSGSGGEGDNPRRRRRFLGPGRIALILLVLLSLIAGLVGWQLAGRHVTVPTVIGKSTADAQAVLRKAHLDPQVAAVDVYSETVPKGLVAAVDPGAGDRVKRGSHVTIKLSLGPERYTVPAVAKLKLAEALSALRVAHLKPETPREVYSDTIPAGSVIGIINLQPGAQAKRDTPVTIAVSRGPEPVDAPKVLGLTGDAAKAALEKLALKVTVVQDFSETVTSGNAIGITPTTGLHRTDPVKLSVSKGPQLIYIPNNIEDYSPEHAEQYLKSLGLKVATFAFPPLDTRILSASPGGGSQVRLGSTVTLYLY